MVLKVGRFSQMPLPCSWWNSCKKSSQSFIHGGMRDDKFGDGLIVDTELRG